MLHANFEILHNRLVTLENRTSMLAKAIMLALKDLTDQENQQAISVTKSNDEQCS